MRLFWGMGDSQCLEDGSRNQLCYHRAVLTNGEPPQIFPNAFSLATPAGFRAFSDTVWKRWEQQVFA